MSAMDCTRWRMGHVAAVLLGMLLFPGVGHAQTVPPKFLVGAVVPQGNRLVPSQKILSLIQTQPGSVYQPKTVEEDVRNLYETKLFANVRANVQRTGENKVKVYFYVCEFTNQIPQIYIAGNDVTRQNVILRQVALYLGLPLTYPGVRLPERRAANLGILETNRQTGVQPTVSVSGPDSDTEFKDILVQVQEQPTGSLIFGVGVNSDAGLTGSLILKEHNHRPE